ncbi:RED-like protein N-terminal region-domain-containing protein [Cytidiella melzeri]|nr:RED-like protein N-terminal region-domain-containing protein [Cytidiella melzeri]
MDQDSFRELLHKPGSASSLKPTTTHTTWGAPSKKAKTKNAKTDSVQPGFKPRAVKKKSDAYRDRAAERREGVAGDYAQVEALAEDFERRNADQDPKTLEEQRRYLGGDSDHTVLVKGLDFALLEQNKARASTTTEDDDTLEQAFIEGSSTTATLPKKRTREEIVAELKNKRTKGDSQDAKSGTSGDAPLDEAKKAGKFKPIGFKPVGGAEKVKKKLGKKAKSEGTNKKVKTTTTADEITAKEPAPASENLTAKPADPQPPQMEEDFDIFAGAGEYTGLDLGDEEADEDSGAEPGAIVDDTRADAVDSIPRRKWFDTEDEPAPSTEPHQDRSKSQPVEALSHPIGIPDEPEEGEEPDEDTPIRLAPLASSAVPSIRDILAADQEEEKQEKRRARKEKKKGNLSAAGKVDRDYQRLKAYTEKKVCAQTTYRTIINPSVYTHICKHTINIYTYAS